MISISAKTRCGRRKASRSFRGWPPISSRHTRKAFLISPPYVIKNVKGVRVGIVGFVTPGIPHWEIPDHYKGYQFEPIVQAAAHHHGIDRQAFRDFSAALAVHVADCLYAYNPDHEIFSRARLDMAYLTALGLADRIPDWKAAAQMKAD